MSDTWESRERALTAKLDPAHVKTRSQAGRTLSYIEGWHAIAEANRIFGFGAWVRETLALDCVSSSARKIGKPPNQRDGWAVTYVARVRVTVDGVLRDGTGAGHGIDADLGLAHESAAKEAETDAMKRALMTFGNPFGLALYDKHQANVGRPEPEPIPQAAVEAVIARASEIQSTEALSDYWKDLRQHQPEIAADETVRRIFAERGRELKSQLENGG